MWRFIVGQSARRWLRLAHNTLRLLGRALHLMNDRQALVARSYLTTFFLLAFVFTWALLTAL